METRLYNVSHFGRKCCVNHLSVSLNHFVQTQRSTVVINNQMKSVLSMLQPIVYEVNSLSADLDRKSVQR